MSTATSPETSPEVLNLRKRQEQAYDDWIDACIKHRDATNRETHPEVVATRAAYDATVESLISMLGENAYCNYVDIELFSVFSDFHKDRTGCRPRFFVTRKDCQEFLASLPAKPADEAGILS